MTKNEHISDTGCGDTKIRVDTSVEKIRESGHTSDTGRGDKKIRVDASVE